MTWATSVPILVFLGLSVPDLGSMYGTDRRQTDTSDVRQHHRLMPPPRGRGHNNFLYSGRANLLIRLRGTYARSYHFYSVSVIMRPSSLGGGRILRRTLSVCLSVCPSVRLFAEVVF